MEAGASEALFPGISDLDSEIRWQFINKVFGIISCQLILTTLVSLLIVTNPPLQHFLTGSIGIQILLFVLSLVLLFPLYTYKDRHPHNLVFLGIWTTVFSTTVGMACTFYQPVIVIQAVALTAAIVVGLTGYSFYATKRGMEFTWMGPILVSALWAMLAWGLIQLFFPPSHLANSIFSLLGALLFSAYIVFDVHMLIRRVSPDEYIWASVSLYLDVINLFMYILRLLGDNRHN